MNRLMVCLGLGSLALVLCASSVVAESPRLISVKGGAGAMIKWHDNLESGWRQSKKLGRPMVIFITSRRCTYCDAMKRDTWCEKSVLERVRQGFIAIRLSPDRNAKSLNRIKVPAYPTTMVGTPEGKIVGYRVGYQPPPDLHALLTETTSVKR